MSLSKENKYPEIRFKGFTEDWEQRKFEDFTKLSQGLQIAISDRHLHPGVNREFYITNEFLKTNSNKKYFIENPADNVIASEIDILMTRTGNTGKVVTNTKGAFHNNFFKIAYDSNETAKNFLYYLLTSNPIQREILKRAGTSTIPDLNHNEFYTIRVSTPKFLEQLKIGTFLKKLDDTIALHQQKLDQLNKLKTIYLQAMLSTAEDNNPQMRFNNFNNEWKQRKLKDITEKGKSYSLSRNSETSNETGYKYIHYGDIHKKVAKIITHKSELPNIEMGNFELLEEGDLILADASEDYQGIAMPSLLAFTPKFKLIAGLHTIVLKPNKEIVDPLFLYYLIRSPKFRRYGYKIGTGMKVFGISATNLTNFESAFPLLKEQVKVSKFLLSLDDNITLQSLKIVQLKKVKKIYLQKMFV